VAQTLPSDEVLQFLRSVFNPLAEQVRWVASGRFSQAYSFLVGEKVFIIRLCGHAVLDPILFYGEISHPR
jgi:hypothetical protein